MRGFGRNLSFGCAALLGLAALSSCLIGAQGAAARSSVTPVPAAQWSVTPVPKPHGGGILWGVSCGSVSRCIAVGQRFSGYGQSGPIGVIETWNGRKWTLQPAPRPVGADLQAISCVSKSSCTAVGLNETRHGSGALVESWNGTRWKIQPNPKSATSADLEAISCASRASCTAVGFFHRAAGGDRALVESWNGKSWKVQPSPAAAQANSELTSVSCLSRSACTAVGRTGNYPLVMNWNGQVWTIHGNPGAYGDTIFSVSCVVEASCAAVGGHPLGGQREGPFAESWDGSTWALEPSVGTAKPIGALDGVSCPSKSACTAVGDGPLAERWNGSSWARQTVPKPGGAGGNAELLSVSCPSAGRCIAVGDFTGTGYSAAPRPIAEIWNL